MPVTKVRGSTQIKDLSITNTQIATAAGIETSKLADGAEFLQRDGSVALTADWSVGTFKITDLAAPTNPNDAARLADVQAATAGLDVKESVRVASTANVDIATGLEAGDTIDGVTLVAGDRVLLKDQTAAAENGIYVAVASGAASRATDADTDAEVNPNMFMFVQEGSANADTGWVLVTDDPITLDTTPLSFTQFSGTGSAPVSGAANVGTDGVGVYDGSTGSTLNFRHIASTNSILAVALDAVDNDIDLTVDQTQIDHNQLLNYSIDEHRTINDAGTAVTDLWSASKIDSELTGKKDDFAILPISEGGTNSGTALNNDRIMISSAGAIVEHAAITADRALISDANGLPIASVTTATELSYVSGVTSSIQTQIDNLVEAPTFVFGEVPSGAINGVNTAYTLAATPIAGTVRVYLNGVRQAEGGSNDYTISGSTITYNAAPETGDTLLVDYHS
jgi:hypothetical protein